MSTGYSYLSVSEREQLYKLRHLSNHGIRQIGRLLGRSSSTISRAVFNNTAIFKTHKQVQLWQQFCCKEIA